VAVAMLVNDVGTKFTARLISEVGTLTIGKEFLCFIKCGSPSPFLLLEKHPPPLPSRHI